MIDFLKQFVIYCIIGLFNTTIHGITFYIFYSFLEFQGICNLLGFLVAVTFSYFANAFFNFKKKPALCAFLKMTFSLGLLAFVLGCYSDIQHIHPAITFIGTVLLSTVLGFLVTKFYVFK